MITFQKLRENAAENVGAVTDILQPQDLANIKEFARQLSASFQANIPETLKQVETELNKFGYTLGELDMELPFGEVGEEDYAVLVFSTGDAVRNVYLTLSWLTLSSGQQYSLRADGSELRLDVKLKINEIDPEEFDFLMVDNSDSVIDTELSDELGEEVKLEESVEDLNESAFQVRKIGRSIIIKSQDGGILEVETPPSGAVVLKITPSSGPVATVTFAKNKATEVMTKILDHYIQFSGESVYPDSMDDLRV